MTDKILQRFSRLDRDDADADRSDSGEVDDFGAYSWLRGIRDRAIMLECRKKNGDSIAFDYSWLRKVEFNPSDGIKLYFGGETVVRIIGRNLNQSARPQMQLLRGILAHRVPWIQEASEPDVLQAAKDATVIEEIACP